MTDDHSEVEAAPAIGEEGLVAAIDQDYTTSVVPMTKRRSNFNMAILWATLQGALVTMVTGYVARADGLSLGELLAAALLAVGIIIGYGIGAANLGARTGQTVTLLARTIFGRAGSGMVSILLTMVGMGWYCFQAFFLATVLQVFFGFENLGAWAALFAVLMIFNNLFGFTGVVAYARYIGTPLLVGWGIWALIKGIATVPSDELFSSPGGDQAISVIGLSVLIIGGLAWGNEPDFFRYSKVDKWRNIPTLLFGYSMGALIFPVAGYLMALLAGGKDFGGTMEYFIDFTLFGATALGIIVFVTNAIAQNDGNLYESINAVQNLVGWARWKTVVLLGAIAAVIASQMGSVEEAIFVVAGISGVFAPSATLIMVIDTFLLPRWFGLKRGVKEVTPWEDAALGNWIGIVAVLSGLVLGCLTGGIIPGLPGYQETLIGYPPLQAWVLAASLYLIGVYLFRNSPNRYRLLGYPKGAVPTEPSPGPDPVEELRPAPAGATP